MRKYGFKTFALGGIVAGSLIAAPSAFAHGGKYSNSGETSSSSSYSWNGETGRSSSETNVYPNSERSQSDQIAMDEQLRRDRDKLAEDMRNGASDEQIAEDQRAIEQDRQELDLIAFNGDGTVVVIPGS